MCAGALHRALNYVFGFLLIAASVLARVFICSIQPTIIYTVLSQ